MQKMPTFPLQNPRSTHDLQSTKRITSHKEEMREKIFKDMIIFHEQNICINYFVGFQVEMKESYV